MPMNEKTCDNLEQLLLKLRQIPFLPLDIRVPLSDMRKEYDQIIEKGYKLTHYQTNYKLVRNYYAKSWSGICLISSDGGLYTDLSEGDIQSSVSEFAQTELLEHCPSFFQLISDLNHNASNTRARIMKISPKRSLLWHSHVLEHGQPEYILTVQVPIYVPKDFRYCVIDKNEFHWYKRFMSFKRFKSLSTSNLQAGSAYVFNSYHYHNVFNLDSSESRITLMVYLDLRNDGIRNLINRSIQRLDTANLAKVAGETTLGTALSIH